MLLYVESDNAPAVATYSRLGFAHTATHVQYARCPGSGQRYRARRDFGKGDCRRCRLQPVEPTRGHAGPTLARLSAGGTHVQPDLGVDHDLLGGRQAVDRRARRRAARCA